MRRIRLQHLIPADGDLPAFRDQLLHSACEISLQGSVVFEVVVAFELLDAGVRVPLFAIALVAADAEISIRKERGHLCEESVEKRVRALLSRVHRWIEDAPLPFDVIGT